MKHLPADVDITPFDDVELHQQQLQQRAERARRGPRGEGDGSPLTPPPEGLSSGRGRFKRLVRSLGDRYLFSVDKSGRAAVWDTTTRARVVSLGGRDWNDPKLEVVAFSFCPLRRNEQPRGEVAVDVEAAPHQIMNAATNIRRSSSAAGATPASLLALATTGTGLLLYDVETGECQQPLFRCNDVVIGIAYSEDGSLIATATVGREVMIWDVLTGLRRCVLDRAVDAAPDRPLPVFFSRDGSRVAAPVSGSGDLVYMWNIMTGATTHKLHGAKAALTGVDISNDGSAIVTISADEAMLWDAKSGKLDLAIDCRRHVPLRGAHFERRSGAVVVLDYADGAEERRKFNVGSAHACGCIVC